MSNIFASNLPAYYKTGNSVFQTGVKHARTAHRFLSHVNTEVQRNELFDLNARNKANQLVGATGRHVAQLEQAGRLTNHIGQFPPGPP